MYNCVFIIISFYTCLHNYYNNYVKIIYYISLINAALHYWLNWKLNIFYCVCIYIHSGYYDLNITLPQPKWGT